MIQNSSGGHWDFPKGHPDDDEEPLETAARELFEETGLMIDDILSMEPFEENYQFKHDGEMIDKTVTLFVAKVMGDLETDEREILDHRWVGLEEARALATFDEGRNVIQELIIKFSK